MAERRKRVDGKMARWFDLLLFLALTHTHTVYRHRVLPSRAYFMS